MSVLDYDDIKYIVDGRMKKFMKNTLKIVKCSHCNPGFRNVIGNCVICGSGPAPGAVENRLPIDAVNRVYQEPIMFW